MKQVIRNAYGAVLFKCEADTFKEAVERAVREGVELRSADLRYADLSGADLRGGNFQYADFYLANLFRADFREANLRGAEMQNSIFYDYENRGKFPLFCGIKFDAEIPDDIRVVPKKGEFIGWKKCCHGVIVKLLIPEDAERSNAFSRKCRASKAVVLEVFGAHVGVSLHDERMIYRVGETVYPDEWDPNWCVECSSGIHFYMTREEAEDY